MKAKAVIIAAPVGVTSSASTLLLYIGTFFNISEVAGAGTGHFPWENSTNPVPTLSFEQYTLPIPNFLKNRRFDPETGETTHYVGTDLEMKHEFDIKKMIKIRSYKGVRHASGQPVRGQKTRSHFRSRKNKQAVGLKKKVKEVKEK